MKIKMKETMKQHLANVNAPVHNEALESAIKEAEGRATARTISVRQVCYILNQVESRLGITKKAMEGITVSVDFNAQDFPSAYKYTPESTRFSAEYHRGEWIITGIARMRTRRASQRVLVSLTDDAKEAILAKYTQMA